MELIAKISIDFISNQGNKEYYVEMLDIPEEVSAGELQEIVDKRVEKVRKMKSAQIITSCIKIDRTNRIRH